MNWEAIGAIGELFGGVVVVLTIIYLSQQVRQSNKFAKAEAERDIQSQWTAITDVVLRDSETREVLRKGVDSFDTLSGSERTAYSVYLSHVINHLEMVLKMERDGLVSDDVAGTYKNVVAQIVGTPGGREYWKVGKNLYQDLSTNHIESFIKDSPDGISVALSFWSPKESN